MIFLCDRCFRVIQRFRNSFFAVPFLLFLPVVGATSQLPETVEKVKQSIVAVGTYQKLRHPRSMFSGTGFAVADGSIIVTNHHVVARSLNQKNKETWAVFKRHKKNIIMDFATLVVSDKAHDLAVLKLKSMRFPSLKLGEEASVREGEHYAFTGFPIGMVLGLFPVTHQGIVSAISPIAIPMISDKQLNKKMLRRLQDPYKVFQLDATAYPGNSGSPLYKQDTAEVIGVINKVFVKETKENVLSKPSGITYAIPVRHVKNLLKRSGFQ